MNELIRATRRSLPEIVLVVGAMALLMLGVFRPESDREAETHRLARHRRARARGVARRRAAGERAQALFDGAFVVDGFGRFMKLLVLAGAGAACCHVVRLPRARQDR